MFLSEDEDSNGIIFAEKLRDVFHKMKIPYVFFLLSAHDPEISGQAFWSQSQIQNSGSVTKKHARRFWCCAHHKKITPIVSSSSQKRVKKSPTKIWRCDQKTCPGLRADVEPARASVAPARADVVPAGAKPGQTDSQRRGNGEPLGADVVPGEKRAL